jgi:hypothetical protein
MLLDLNNELLELIINKNIPNKLYYYEIDGNLKFKHFINIFYLTCKEFTKIKCTKLKILHLNHTKISNLYYLINILYLNDLNLFHTKYLYEFKYLSYFKNLIHLNLGMTNITDLNVLKKCNLDTLNLTYCKKIYKWSKINVNNINLSGTENVIQKYYDYLYNTKIIKFNINLDL